MSGHCGSCREQYPATAPAAAPKPKYQQVVADPLIDAADTPGVVRRLTALADPVLVKQVPGFALSSSVHTPDGPLRVTQSNIGKYLVPSTDTSQPQRSSEMHVEDRILDNWAVRDKAWWVDKPGKNAPFLFCVHNKYSVPQPFNPFASHTSKFPLFPHPDICDALLEGELSGTGDDYQPPCPHNDVSHRLPRSHDQNQRHLTEAQENPAYKDLCDCPPTDACCAIGPRKTFAKCQVSPSENEVPFWWGGSPSLSRALTVGDMDHYARIPIYNQHDVGQDLMGTLLLDRRERYLPGQVFCEERRKIHGIGNWSYTRCHPPPLANQALFSPEEMAAERATCEQRPWSLPQPRPGASGGRDALRDCRDGVLKRAAPAGQGKCRPCVEGIQGQNEMGRLERDRCEQLRKEQLLKVGQPFKSAACRWYHQLYPPQTAAVIGRTKTREFPHTRLTSI